MSRSLLVLTSVAVLGLTACSSSTEPAGNTLASLDARRAADAFASIGGGSGSATLAVVDSITSACPQGGTVRTTMLTSGSISPARADVVLANCAVADDAGALWTFTSLPLLALSATATIADSIISSVTTVSGTMRVESSTVRGTCNTNTRLEAVLRLTSGGTLRIRQSGEVCGQAIDTTYTVTAPK